MTKKSTVHTQSLKIPTIILHTCKLIAFFSPKLVTLFAAKLFTTPTKYKVPKRELTMESKSLKSSLHIPAINKEIVLYEYGKSDRKILLVHGWSGRGTQLFKIADALLQKNYKTISFDAPAHGKSNGSSGVMTDFIASILEIDKIHGPFDGIVGHSLGGMSVLNAIKNGIKVNKGIIIGSGDVVSDIINDFIAKLKLDPKIGLSLRAHFEEKYKDDMNNYSASHAAKEVHIPVLVIHDEDDPEVPVSAAHNIHNHLKKGELLITNGLGHRKILGNSKVIEVTIAFLEK
ncbi:pimeloyl-ACP methyl ester carboxylesterase [Flavobacterium tiangeerense]|uniref:Pimeloyl-ACP methyl ester carboxylesterase n=1 Tax=Flavobacterium tiangeerense TaxID=459471 RepID=A0ABY3FL09_9FLAO|nr:alpha/beta hydrolase [Flavobacterium tiangeerense]TWI00663.1 pimeloyl-ACP methyl ester carboxylesterase [Flavobacterium tiangeerense]